MIDPVTFARRPAITAVMLASLPLLSLNQSCHTRDSVSGSLQVDTVFAEDFFIAMIVTEQKGDPGAARFYTYYPSMAREGDGATCWGRYGDGTETYVPPLTLSPDAWHRVEFWVKLNDPGLSNASQTFWIDGVQRGTWSGFSFRRSAVLRLNSVQLSFNRGISGGPTTQTLWVDHLVVATGRQPS